MQGTEGLVVPQISYPLLLEEQLERRQHQMCIAYIKAAYISSSAQEF